MRFTLIGPGRLGLHLARALACRGAVCERIRARRARPSPDELHAAPEALRDTWTDPAPGPPSPLVVVAVPDRLLSAVDEMLAAWLEATTSVVLHTSGYYPATVLAACRRTSSGVASWHPLQSFPAGMRDPVRWSGVPCAVEGDPAAVELGFELAHTLGMVPWSIRPEDKPRYHAAASVAGNLTHILVAAARELMAGTGIPGDPSASLRPLVETSLDNAFSDDPWRRLTGPLARRDAEVVARHLEVLPEALRDAYLALAREVERRTASDCVD